MTNKGSKDDFASAVNARSGQAATSDETRDVTERERESQRDRQEKRREPLSLLGRDPARFTRTPRRFAKPR
ncbi:hypothetical protein [Paraburkholderia sp. BR10882]|uniref:hypothetical protein n=1 Tax=Paraburkholderia sp. BR10882 TaxID=3236991 RepID=UPI0034CD5414